MKIILKARWERDLMKKEIIWLCFVFLEQPLFMKSTHAMVCNNRKVKWYRKGEFRNSSYLCFVYLLVLLHTLMCF